MPDLGHLGVVKFIPLVVVWIPGKGRVMTEAHVAVVVGDGIAVVNHILAFLGALEVLA